MAIELSTAIRQELLDIVNDRLKKWLEQQSGITITISINKLGLAWIESLEEVYQKAREDEKIERPQEDL